MTVDQIMKLADEYSIEMARAAIAVHTGLWTTQKPTARAALLAAVEELAKDAERYRFLRDADKCDMHTDQIWQYAIESLDGAVDAGIAAMKGQS